MVGVYDKALGVIHVKMGKMSADVKASESEIIKREPVAKDNEPNNDPPPARVPLTDEEKKQILAKQREKERQDRQSLIAGYERTIASEEVSIDALTKEIPILDRQIADEETRETIEEAAINDLETQNLQDEQHGGFEVSGGRVVELTKRNNDIRKVIQDRRDALVTAKRDNASRKTLVAAKRTKVKTLTTDIVENEKKIAALKQAMESVTSSAGDSPSR